MGGRARDCLRLGEVGKLLALRWGQVLARGWGRGWELGLGLVKAMAWALHAHVIHMHTYKIADRRAQRRKKTRGERKCCCEVR